MTKCLNIKARGCDVNALAAGLVHTVREYLENAYFTDCFSEGCMGNGVRVNLLQKHLYVSCIQIR